MFQFESTSIEGVINIVPKVHNDDRGAFVKTYAQSTFLKEKLNCQFSELLYSVSKKNVFRGFHFQTPPNQQKKLVYVTLGQIIDIVVDIRKDSPTYGQHVEIPIVEGKNIVFVDAGLAHGFYTTSERAVVNYALTAEYSPESDDGIRFDSIGVKPFLHQAIISEKDRNFKKLENYTTPF